MTFEHPIPTSTAKPDAFRQLEIQVRGTSITNPYHPAMVVQALRSIEKEVGRPRNEKYNFVQLADSFGARTLAGFGERSVFLEPPIYIGERPAFFPEGLNGESSAPALDLIEVNDGTVCLLPDGPIIFDAAGNVLEPISSSYSRLLYYYDVSIEKLLANALVVDAPLFAMSDDVWPLNYCHWVADWCTRFALINNSSLIRSLVVLTSPLLAGFQRHTLSAAGIPEGRVLQGQPLSAYRSKKLLVPSNLGPGLRHPAHSAAPWALGFLRDTYQRPNARTHSGIQHPRRLYVSREDAPGRKLINEAEVSGFLASRGFTKVHLSSLSHPEQVAAFSSAEQIVGLHGAGLTNIVFAPRDSHLVEVFPRTYGTPAFWILAAGSNDRYSSIVQEPVASPDRSQLDDVSLDLEVLAAALES